MHGVIIHERKLTKWRSLFGSEPCFLMQHKNRRKAIFNWAAKGLFFLRGGCGYTHSGYHKTLSATIACDRTSSERVSMGLTDRRKTAKNLVDSRKN